MRKLRTESVRGKQGKLVEASWEEALGAAAAKLKAIEGSKVAAIAGDQCDAEAMVALLREARARLDAERASAERCAGEAEQRVTLLDALTKQASDVRVELEGVDGEYAVLALTVRAARALEFKDSRGALRLLREAIPHARFVGNLIG